MHFNEGDPHHAVPRRIVVGGTTGSGKSTTARRIADITGYPYVELDALHWEPNWTPAATDVLRERVQRATAGACWVVDGNYAAVRDLTWGNAELLLWLDYSIARVYWQLFTRFVRRYRRNEELWNGNRETIRAMFLSRESLIVWALQTHWKKRRTYVETLRDPAYARLRLVRVRSPRELERWLAAFESRVRASGANA